MAAIKGKDTRPEMAVRKGLHALGFRYRLHDGALPGRPDLVFPKHEAVVFIHGCFWHGHEGCEHFRMPKTRRRFWQEKISGNIERDSRTLETLKSDGWRVMVVWECALRGKGRMPEDKLFSSMQRWLVSKSPFREVTGRAA